MLFRDQALRRRGDPEQSRVGAAPAGLQLAGRRGADAALLRVAAAAEGLITGQQQLMKAQP